MAAGAEECWVNGRVSVGNDLPTSSHDHLPLVGTASAEHACLSTVKEPLMSIHRYTEEGSSGSGGRM